MGAAKTSLRIAIPFAIAALTALLAWRTESSRDFGFHVAMGRWILEHRAWPQVDSLTWTLAGRPYVDMNGLFQIVLDLVYGSGGMIGVSSAWAIHDEADMLVQANHPDHPIGTRVRAAQARSGG